MTTPTRPARAMRLTRLIVFAGIALVIVGLVWANRRYPFIEFLMPRVAP